MELDKDLLNKIENLDDDEFKNKFSDVLDSLKVNRIKKQKLLANFSQIKESVNTLTQEDIDGFVKKIGEEKLNDIVSIIKNNMEEW